MLPLLKVLPALVLQQITYVCPDNVVWHILLRMLTPALQHLRGPVSKPDFQEFSAQAKLVGEFTLSGKHDTPSDAHDIAPGTFVRLG